MAEHYATPNGRSRRLASGVTVGQHLQEAIDKAEPGDTIHLLPGVYDEPVVIEGKRGTPERPIVLLSDGCATLDGRRNVVRPPDIGGITDRSYAFIKILRSSGIRIESTTIQNAWPTAIYVEDVQHLTIRALELNGATYGVFARGTDTRHIVIERCSWIQDTRIWDEVSWHDIHDRPNPRRELDGDFFRSFDIKGDVVIRNNFIAQAFNGIHLFASRKAAAVGGVNENVWVYRNTFAFIRDSAVEAERTALNWWIFENRIYNCHTWFAFQECRGGFWYVFANRGWFDRKPGPAGDCHAGGAVIKTNPVDGGREDEALPEHPFYMFNNSWYLRSPLLKKGKLRNFHHRDNAIAFARPEHHRDGVVELGRRMIGVGAPDPRCDGAAPPEPPFTKDWGRLGIVFENDVCDHPDFPDGLRRQGYPVNGFYGDPGFAAGRDGDFSLVEGSPCLERGQGGGVDLVDGSVWQLPPKLNVGAMRAELPYTPDDLGCPMDALPPDYQSQPMA